MKKKIIISIVTIICILAAAGGIAGGMYYYGRSVYADHFLPNTTIDGKKLGNTDMDTFLSSVRERYPDEFTITEDDGTKITIPLTEVILNKDIEEFVSNLKTLADEWPLHYTEEISFTPKDTWDIDEEKVKSLVLEALDNDGRKAPQDAYLNEKTFEIVPEQEGRKLYEDRVVDDVLTALKENRLDVSLDDSYYLKPSVRKDDSSLTSIIEERNSLITGSVKVKVAGSIKDEISEDQLEEWLTYEDGKFDFDKDKINEYTAGLAYSYNTAYSWRTFETSYGTEIEVGRNAYDSYVGYMLDEETTASDIYNVLINKEKKVSCTWLTEGYTMDENGDIGGTYIEICISSQHMWYYQDYELMLETDVVTGLESNPERRTPRGLFYLLQMSSPYVMHGDYGQQPCEYFIKVTWDGVAIHDADWQPTFGGTQYIYGGSHGCINTPHYKVAALWDYLYALDDWQIPVIIYD